MKQCEFCRGPLPPPAKTGGQVRKFCRDLCRVRSWKMKAALKKMEAEERKRERAERRARRVSDAGV